MKVVIPAEPTVAAVPATLMAKGLLEVQFTFWLLSTGKFVETALTSSLFCNKIGVAATFAAMLSCNPVGMGYLSVTAVKPEPGYVANPTRSVVFLA